MFRSKLLYWFELILRMGGNFLIVGFLYHDLSDVDFGLFSVLLSVHAIILVVSKFGCENYLLSKYSKSPSVLKNVILVRFLVVLAISFPVLFIVANYTSFVISVIYIILLLSSLGVEREQCLIANNEIELISIAKVIAFFISSFFKLFAIWFDCDVEFLFLVYVSESLVLNLILCVFLFGKEYNRFIGRAEWKSIKKVFTDCFPLAIASASVILYSRIDQVILEYLLGAEFLSHYAMAIRVSDISLMVVSLYMTLNVSKLVYALDGGCGYLKLMKIFYRNSYAINFLIVLSVYFLGSLFFSSIFNDEVLKLIVLIGVSNTFSVMGIVYGRYLVVSGENKIVMYRTLLGLVMNVVLNFILIPYVGVLGAVVSTVISQVFTNLAFDLFVRRCSDFRCKLLL